MPQGAKYPLLQFRPFEPLSSQKAHYIYQNYRETQLDLENSRNTMAFNTGTIVPHLKSFATHSKNVQTCLERFPSTAAKKKFAAKLRRIRWRIYQRIRLKKRRVQRTLVHYQKQVKKFLKEFSTKLQPQETSIWTAKITKTSADVHASIINVKSVIKKEMKAQSCFECSNKLDSLLLMLSTVLHLVKKDQATGNDLKNPPAKKMIFEAPVEQEAMKAKVDDAEKSLEEVFEAPIEDGYDEIVVAASVHKAKKTGDAKAVKDPIDKDSEEYKKSTFW